MYLSKSATGFQDGQVERKSLSFYLTVLKAIIPSVLIYKPVQPMNNKSLAIRIRMLRESKHLKQEYVAEQIGVSPATYSKIENGKTSLSTTRLQQIANVLQLSTTLLLAEDSIQSTDDCKKIIAQQKQQLEQGSQKIFELEQERVQSLEREQRLLNYIKMLERQTM
jgi:transcriptional regulator with XRE-family HTH domain